MATKTANASSKEGHSKDCPCQSCSCGHHKCSSNDPLHYDPKIQSEYGERFPVWPISKRKPHSPSAENKELGPFYDETTYNVEFAKKALPKRTHPGKSPDSGLFNGSHIEANSEYSDNFRKHPLQQKQSPKRQDGPINSGPFEDATTYDTEFQKWPTIKRAPHKPSAVKENVGPFDATTSYKVDFWDKSKELKRSRHIEPVRKAESGEFYDETTYGEDFGPKKMPMRRSGDRKDGSLGSPGAKLEVETTYNVDFKDWKVKKPSKSHPAKEATPPQPFYSETTYNMEYCAKEPVKRCSGRPKPTVVSAKH